MRSLAAQLRQEHRTDHRDRKQELIGWIDGLKTRAGCKLCGEKHPGCLVFHHNNSEDKHYEISRLITKRWSKDRILLEIGKCSVLCANCHSKLHWEKARGVGV